jgi:thiol-disulfide isomerase/thioredoxin
MTGSGLPPRHVRQCREPRRARAAVMGLALALSAGCGAGPSAERGQHPDQVGVIVVAPGDRKPAPDLSGRSLSGRPLELADRLGNRATVVAVWASWCWPCRQEMPILVRAAEHTSGVRVVGVDERDSVTAARALSSSLGATYPSLVDPHSTLLMRLPMLPQDAVPSTLFIDAHGKVAASVIGPITAKELRSVLSRIRATT